MWKHKNLEGDEMKNLRLIREKSKMTQKQIADELEICRPYYTMIENGQRKPSLLLSLKIADLFKYSVEELFGELKK